MKSGTVNAHRTPLPGNRKTAEVVRAVLELNLYKPREMQLIGHYAAEVQNRKRG